MGVIPPIEVEFIERAARYLENPSFMVRLADLVGIPVEGALQLAPESLSRAVNLALRRSLDLAIVTLPRAKVPALSFPTREDKVWWTGYRHSAGTAITGGLGGMFGSMGLLVELPVTTSLMLRSMTAIARDFGEDVRSIDVRLECLSLFGLGGPSGADDEMDASYLAMRASLSSMVKHASKFVAHSPSREVLASIKNGTAPTLVKFVGKIAQRFELSVSEKLIAQSVPIVGAVGGATINLLFSEHFNAVARYHFGLRCLERRWGEETVRAIYQEASAVRRARATRPTVPMPNYGYRGVPGIADQTTKPR
jgi:hypothetical protein